MKDVNKIILKGKLISTGRDMFGHNAITLIIGRKKPAFVRVVLKNGQALDPDIAIGDRLEVLGYTKAYAYKEDEKWTDVQYFIADEIIPLKTELEIGMGVKGRFYEESSFKAFLAGEVSAVLTPKEGPWGKLVLKVDADHKTRKPSFITVNYYKEGWLPEFNYSKGDNVCVYTGINTPKKEIDGKQRTFENLVVEDIIKVG